MMRASDEARRVLGDVRFADGVFAYPVTGKIGKDGKVVYQLYGVDRKVRRYPTEAMSA